MGLIAGDVCDVLDGADVLQDIRPGCLGGVQFDGCVPTGAEMPAASGSD